MKKYIGCDAHARYSIFASLREDGGWDPLIRVEHNELEMERFLKQLPAGSPVALESSGNWYWLVRAMEEAGLEPRLAHALEAKKRMPGRNKTDHLDAKGLALMLRNGSLPEVWVPPASLLDLRDLMRTRLSMRQQGSELKCRILAALRRYGVRRYEDGAVSRFPDAAHLASYAGLVPTVHSSGGKGWQGPTPRSANHFLKWAFVEAANVVSTRQKAWAEKHVVHLYQRLKATKCHGKAVTAVARHLAESSWWILSKKQPYREPALATMSSSKNG